MRKLLILGVLLTSSVAFAQGKGKGKEPALYNIDTDAMKAPGGSALARILKAQAIRVCVRSDVPPFGSFSAGRLRGFDVQLARELVTQLGIDYKKVLSIEWSIVSAKGRVARLQNKSCDMLVATFSKTGARAAKVGLSKVYLKTDKVLVAATNIKRKTPIIGRVKGTTAGAGVRGKSKYFDTYQQIIFAMDQGQVDYVVADRPVATHMIRSTSGGFKITKTLAKGAENYVIGTNKWNKHLLKAVDKALADLAQSGRLAFLARRWL